MTDIAFEQAASLIQQADGIFIAAGAGMGVDSGLPDFRGPSGFWDAYPALGRAGLSFQSIANPQTFRLNAKLAWGFYGHRLKLYRETEPNMGFQILRRIAENLEHGAFVFTSNVDGQFQKAGFSDNRIREVHGSIHHFQCLDNCRAMVWPAKGFQPQVNEESCLLVNKMPTCPWCNELARPNILMFEDWGWQPIRSELQTINLKQWKAEVKRGVVIEIGAGKAIPTVRHFSQNQKWPVIRINPFEADLNGAEGVALSLRGADAMAGIQTALDESGFWNI